MRALARVVLLALLAPLFLVGCGATPGSDTGGGQPPAPEPAAGAEANPPQGTAEVQPAAVEPEVRAAEVAEIRSAVAASGKDAVVLNVWATWCAPCREEFPDLMRLERDYRDRGVQLLLVSADFDDRLPEVKRFLQRQGVDFPSFLKVGDDMEFIDALSPKWSGALPATFIYDGAGKLRYFHEGKATYALLERQVLEIIGSGARPGTEERS